MYTTSRRAVPSKVVLALVLGVGASSILATVLFWERFLAKTCIAALFAGYACAVILRRGVVPTAVMVLLSLTLLLAVFSEGRFFAGVSLVVCMAVLALGLIWKGRIIPALLVVLVTVMLLM